jgi:hypothetical protein
LDPSLLKSDSENEKNQNSGSCLELIGGCIINLGLRREYSLDCVGKKGNEPDVITLSEFILDTPLQYLI